MTRLLSIGVDAGLTKYEAKLMRELDNLSDKQKLVLLHGYVTGKDTGYDVLPAIAWKESGFGKKVINSKDGYSGSFGVYKYIFSISLCPLDRRSSTTTIIPS